MRNRGSVSLCRRLRTPGARAPNEIGSRTRSDHGSTQGRELEESRLEGDRDPSSLWRRRWNPRRGTRLYAANVPRKLDWDREQRERRAREHGREPVWIGLVTGVAELRRRWREKGRGQIWVLPALDEAALLVLLPPCEDDRWCVQLKRPEREWAPGFVFPASLEEKYSQGGNPAIVRFPYFGGFSDSSWEVSVYRGDDQYAFESFGDFWPTREIWNTTRR
jgi:hypothetical protein